MDPVGVNNIVPLERKGGAAKSWHGHRDCKGQAPAVSTSRWVPKPKRRGKSSNDISREPPTTTKPRRTTVAIGAVGGSNSRSISNKNKSTCLRHLDLGDIGRSNDMLANCGIEKIQKALRNYVFCFILRSDRTWTYAIVANKEEDLITFVVDKKGGTKMIRKRNWLESIRLVNSAKRPNQEGGATAKADTRAVRRESALSLFE